ncbi:MFS general substrate transporter [Mollisia scopiformis]|uniref:MFS general substrate transporter n=1 Tax=Mollisia scopiformis TaxID=149040 RepID=A0A132BDK0_MOLSC|nr:MFS general substrate transporter [Mollisia scopiformis]KUJ10466.1 MFS general substrate transporter [Mollisia scopiformis]
MSIRRSSAQTPPPSARPFFPKYEESQTEIEVDEEEVGTIVVHPDEAGRRVLRPQPSWDPNDPLNWNKWQKYKAYFTICLFAFLATANAIKFTIASPQLSHEFGISVLEIKFLTAFNLLALGAGALFWVPLSRVIGKRPVFLLALPILVAANIWSSQIHRYDQLLASSILSAFGSAAATSVVPAVVADLFFVHERATAMMWFQVSLSSGLFLGTLINGLVVQYFSWRINSYWIAIAAAFVWLLAIYTVEETTYYDRDILKPIHGYGPKKNHWQRMELTRGWVEGQNLWRALGNLVAIAAYPGVFWAALTLGVFAGWNMMLRLSLIQNFSTPPESHSTQFLGLTSLAPLTGSLIAILLFGKGLDALSARITRKHEGGREPEYRLYLIPILIFLGGASIVITSFTLHGTSSSEWIAPIIGWGIHGFALTGISNMVLVYAVDSYLAFAGEIGALASFISEVVGFVIVLWGEEWVEVMGGKTVFGTLVGVQCFFALLAVVFLVCGKKIRVWTGRWGVLRWERRRG